MNWKHVLVWSLSATFLFYYLLVMGVFAWASQEEAQLFMPHWKVIRGMLVEPGGFCAVVGEWIVQYYRQPMLAVTSHTTLLIGCGVMISRLLRGSFGNIRNIFLALIPIFYLAGISVRAEYFVDGTVGLFVMLLLLSVFTKIRDVRHVALYGALSTILLFWLAGYLSVYYAILYTLFALLNKNVTRYSLALTLSLLPALFISLFGGDMGIPVPLWDGLMEESFLESQRLPHYYIYRVWNIFMILLVFIAILAYIIWRASENGKWVRRSLSVLCVILMSLSAYANLPNSLHSRRIMFDELAFLYREKRWEHIINMYRGREINNYLVLNYLNMSLARQGELADKIFMFDQKGVKGLCADWDQSFYMDRLLSDLYFLTGSISMSESYAMDGFAQAKRNGSATMMQRMVQISLLKGEMSLAKKYLNLLIEMPFYEEWAREYYKYVDNPELMEKDPELKGKSVDSIDDDRLLISLPVDSLWHDSTNAGNRVAWEYRGCYYLLDKRLDEFAGTLKDFSLKDGESLPRYFQEALLLIDADADLRSSFSVKPEINERYVSFKNMMRRSSAQVDLSSIYRQFGDTYWFYYYFKNNKGGKR